MKDLNFQREGSTPTKDEMRKLIEVGKKKFFENGLTIKDEDHNQMSTYWIPTNIEGISKRVHIDEKIAHLQHKADVLLNEINRLNKLKEKHK